MHPSDVDDQVQQPAYLSWGNEAAGVVPSGAALEQHLEGSQLGCHHVLHWVAAAGPVQKRLG